MKRNWKPFLNVAVRVTVMAMIMLACAEKHNHRSFLPLGTNENKSSDAEKDSDTSDPAPTPAPVDAPTDVKNLYAAVGVRNFQQVNEAMAVVTGISPATAAVKTAYDELKTQMPDNNDIRAFLSAHQAAFTKLAVEYCDAMLSDAAKQKELFGSLNVAGAPKDVFNAANKSMIAKAFTSRFWGDGRADVMPAADVEKINSDLIDAILTGKSSTDTTLTLKILKGVCTAFLAASPVTLL